MVCYASKYIGIWNMLFNSFYQREFVMSLQVIIYAKQNGAQMATFAATGTRADIDDLRCRAWERGCVTGGIAKFWPK